MKPSVETLLQPYEGYLELGMWQDANEVLEALPRGLKTHHRVLLARLELLVEMGRWEDGVILGESLIDLGKGEPEFYLQTAFCLHELNRTTEALVVLKKAPETVRDTPPFLYNLACYESMLGNLKEAKVHLSRCFILDKSYHESSLDDEDLKALWESIDGDTI